jgi:hypothetical protein
LRCACTERSSASSVSRELVAPRLLHAFVLEPLRVGGDPLGLAREALNRRHRGPSHEHREHRGERDATRCDQHEQQELVGQRLVDLGERLRHDQRPARAEARDEHANVRALDRPIGEILAASAPRQRLHPGVGGDLAALALRCERLPVGVNEQEGAGPAERGPADLVEPEALVADARSLATVPAEEPTVVRRRAAGPERVVQNLPAQPAQRIVDLPQQLAAGAGVR